MQRRGYAHLDTILTRNATQFVTPVTLEAITGRMPYTGTFEPGRTLSHIDLVQGSGLLAIVPATANMLAKMAGGIGDDLLSTSYLAADCPVLVAPSMNTKMMEHPATVRNLARLREDGVYLVDPDDGYLACGTYGRGRMPDVPALADHLELALHRPHGILSGKRVLIASGGTSEPIDPVRSITNRSTGKMGSELAGAFLRAGASVKLVTGTGSARYPATADRQQVETAAEMAQAVSAAAAEADIIVMAAAVADYTPAEPASEKRKKTGDPIVLPMDPTVDILKQLGSIHAGKKTLVGFAAETSNVEQYATGKLKEKQADLIVGNRVGAADTGFGSDTNEAVLVARDGQVINTGCITKEALAVRIVGEVKRLSGDRHA